MLPLVLVGALEIGEGLADGDLREGGREEGREGGRDGKSMVICAQQEAGREEGRKGGSEHI